MNYCLREIVVAKCCQEGKTNVQNDVQQPTATNHHPPPTTIYHRQSALYQQLQHEATRTCKYPQVPPKNQQEPTISIENQYEPTSTNTYRPADATRVSWSCSCLLQSAYKFVLRDMDVAPHGLQGTVQNPRDHLCSGRLRWLSSGTFAKFCIRSPNSCSPLSPTSEGEQHRLQKRHQWDPAHFSTHHDTTSPALPLLQHSFAPPTRIDAMA